MGKRLDRTLYETELLRLQAELVKLQEWVRAEGARRGHRVRGPGRGRQGRRDQTGHRVPQPPRRADRGAAGAHRAASAPSGTSSATSSTCRPRGEIVLFDRSWYNRAGVERVMGFCTPGGVPAGSCTSARSSSGCWSRTASCCASTGSRSATRSRSAGSGPARRPACAGGSCRPMDLESITRWEDYSRAKDEMFVHTDIPEAPLVRGGERGQAPGPDQHDRPPAVHGPVPRGARSRSSSCRSDPRPPATRARRGTCRPTSPTTRQPSTEQGGVTVVLSVRSAAGADVGVEDVHAGPAAHRLPRSQSRPSRPVVQSRRLKPWP